MNNHHAKLGLVDLLTYEFTRDPALLRRYYLLRQTPEDYFDGISYLLVARRGASVLGGCRLTLRVSGEDLVLPMESAAFRLEKIFKNFNLVNNACAEISCFVVDAAAEDSLQREITLELVARTVEKMLELNVRFMFFQSTRAFARNWRMMAYSMGLSSHRICAEIMLQPNASGADCVLTYLELPVNAAAQGVEWAAMLSSH